MKKLIIAGLLFVLAITGYSQTWVNNSQSFTVRDPLFDIRYYQLKIPQDYYLDSSGTFLSDDGGLVATYEVDYDPSVKSSDCIDRDGNVDLKKYASKLTAEDIYYMEEGKLSRKIVAAKTESVNGVRAIQITFDYEELFDGKMISGKGYVYLIPARGDGTNISSQSDMVIKLSFIYDNSEIPVANQTIHKEILRTISTFGSRGTGQRLASAKQ